MPLITTISLHCNTTKTTIAVAVFAATGLLSACATPSIPLPSSGDGSSTPAAKAVVSDDEIITSDLAIKPEPPSRRGNPDSYKVFGQRYAVKATSAGYRARGHASWYGPKFHGRLTSSGEPFDMHQLSAAHKSLPIPTWVRVTRLDNGRSLVVRVNDRGPFIENRIIDLSHAAAKKLGMVKDGTAEVEVVALPPYQYLAGAEPSAEPKPAPAVTEKPHTLPRTAPAVADAPPSGTEPLLAAPKPPALIQDQPSLVTAGPPAATAAPTPFTADRVPQAFLQVAAFSGRGRAEQLKTALSGQLEHPIAVDQSAPGVHRVRIGPIGSRGDELDTLKLRLTELGYGDAYLIYQP